MTGNSALLIIIYCIAINVLFARSDDHVTKPPIVNRTICYPVVGCFNNSHPFDNAGGSLPFSPDKIGTTFLLFTRQNRNHGESQKMSYEDDSLNRKSFFSVSKETKILIHGFGKTEAARWLHQTKDELLKLADFNVIIIGWGPGAQYPDYNQAVANTRIVGKQIYLLIKLLVQRGAKLDKFHLIGHSLGAHANGYAGALLQGKLRRLTGLDPAEPGYQNQAIAVRIDPSDAKFVDIVHTNGDPIYEGGFGMIQQCGHVDFYVNGGESQPGCPSVVGGVLSSIFGGNASGVSKIVTCSHSRAHDLFNVSIATSCPFTAYPCSSYESFMKGECLACGPSGCSQFGYFSDQFSARGKMYLNTLGSPPFCGFHYGIKIEGSNHTKATKGHMSVKLNGTLGESNWMPITEDDSEHFDPGTVYSTVVVSDIDIGDLTTMDIKYEKYAGIIFGWGAGEDTFTARTLLVTAGESHKTFEFCLEDVPLQDQKEVKLDVTFRRSC